MEKMVLWQGITHPSSEFLCIGKAPSETCKSCGTVWAPQFCSGVRTVPPKSQQCCRGGIREDGHIHAWTSSLKFSSGYRSQDGVGWEGPLRPSHSNPQVPESSSALHPVPAFHLQFPGCATQGLCWDWTARPKSGTWGSWSLGSLKIKHPCLQRSLFLLFLPFLLSQDKR